MLKPMAPTLTGSPRALGLEQADAVGERVEHVRDHAGETSSRQASEASSRAPLPGLPCLDRLRDVSDVELLELFQQTERVVREANATKAQIAGEMKRRSPVSAGHSGLAARLGEKSPERLIQRLTGVGAGEARQLTATGVLMQDAESGTSPWLAPVADAVASGELSVGAAAAVANGLGERVDGVSIDEQTAATAELIEFARVATPEETANRARAVRAARVSGAARAARARGRSNKTRVARPKPSSRVAQRRGRARCRMDRQCAAAPIWASGLTWRNRSNISA